MNGIGSLLLLLLAVRAGCLQVAGAGGRMRTLTVRRALTPRSPRVLAADGAPPEDERPALGSDATDDAPADGQYDWKTAAPPASRVAQFRRQQRQALDPKPVDWGRVVGRSKPTLPHPPPPYRTPNHPTTHYLTLHHPASCIIPPPPHPPPPSPTLPHPCPTSPTLAHPRPPSPTLSHPRPPVRLWCERPGTLVTLLVLGGFTVLDVFFNMSRLFICVIPDLCSPV